MVGVLVLGANGYIGFNVSVALRRAGYVVYGVIRKKEAARKLEQNEIIPVIADATDVSTFAHLFPRVSTVIDTINDVSQGKPGESNRILLDTLIKYTTENKQPRRYVYTSGCLVYGDHPNEIVDETSELKGLGKGRIELERYITSQGKKPENNITTTVIRPAWVYGADWGHYIAHWFLPNKDGDIEINGSPDKKWSWIHVFDLADAYVKVVDAAANLVNGEIYDVNDDTRATYGQIKEAVGRAGGVKGKVVVLPAGEDLFSKLTETTIVSSGQKIRRALGWSPKIPNLLDHLEIYAAAAKASKEAH